MVLGGASASCPTALQLVHDELLDPLQATTHGLNAKDHSFANQVFQEQVLDAAVGRGLFGGLVTASGRGDERGETSGSSSGWAPVGRSRGSVGSRAASFLPTFEADFAPLLKSRAEWMRWTIRQLEARLHAKLVAEGRDGLKDRVGDDWIVGSRTFQPHGGIGKDGTGTGPTIVVIETGTTTCPHDWDASTQATLIWDRFAGTPSLESALILSALHTALTLSNPRSPSCLPSRR